MERLIVASCMSLYGEGLYRASDGTLVAGASRTLQQLRDRDWQPRDAKGAPLMPIATPETKALSLASVYALSKFDQERVCLRSPSIMCPCRSRTARRTSPSIFRPH